MLRGRKEDEMPGARVERNLLCSRPDYTFLVVYVYAHRVIKLTGSYASNGVTALGLVLIRQWNDDDLRQKYLRPGEQNTRGAILLKIESILARRVPKYISFFSRDKRESRAVNSRNLRRANLAKLLSSTNIINAMYFKEEPVNNML